MKILPTNTSGEMAEVCNYLVAFHHLNRLTVQLVGYGVRLRL
jgi:hypothetical protein